MKIGVCGHFGDGNDFFDGQTVKTKIVTSQLEKKFGVEHIVCVDTYGGIQKVLSHIFGIIKMLFKCDNIIILPAQNGLRVIAPLLIFLNIIFKRNIYYDVIGGWLPEFVSKRKILREFLKRIDKIFVETKSMKKQLENQGFKNIDVVPNCKELDVINEYEVKNTISKPYKLCTFSRVMKEKGIEDAIQAVYTVNSMWNDVYFELDIYGQVDNNQKQWFKELQLKFPPYINYRGIVPFNQTTKVLKKYDALLFPTYYEGEGFAGTLIDSFAAGLPVIASDWKYNSEIVDSGKTGIVFETRNVKELQNAIISIHRDLIKWNSMKKNCLREAKKYLPDNAMEKMINLVNR